MKKIKILKKEFYVLSRDEKETLKNAIIEADSWAYLAQHDMQPTEFGKYMQSAINSSDGTNTEKMIDAIIAGWDGYDTLMGDICGIRMRIKTAREIVNKLN